MTMVSSGQLQLGGSVSASGLNRSVNLELEVASNLANQSMNASARRTLAGAPSGQIAMSSFYGKSRYSDITVTMGNHATPIYVNEFITLYRWYYGYGSTVAAFGSRSPTSVFGHTISDIHTIDDQNSNDIKLVVRLATAGLSQSFFTSVYNGLFGTKNTASASSFSNSGSSVWTWIIAGSPTSGPWYGVSGNQNVRFYKTA